MAKTSMITNACFICYCLVLLYEKYIKLLSTFKYFQAFVLLNSSKVCDMFLYSETN